MNRYISVPSKLLNNNTLPEEAMRLARMFSLEIKLEENADEIKIVSEPKHKSHQYNNFYTRGKTWSIDLHDEFVDFQNQSYMLINGEKHLPKIKEKHLLKFRIRPQIVNSFDFVLCVGGQEYLNGKVYEK